MGICCCCPNDNIKDDWANTGKFSGLNIEDNPPSVSIVIFDK